MLINYDGKDVQLPDFLIVGAAKSGTTSLHYYLKQHPQVFMPKVKELWFFCFMDNPPDYADKWWKEGAVCEFKRYMEYFRGASNGQVIGEACPGYLYSCATTIGNIKKVYKERWKDLKIIIILRSPAELAWSLFSMRRRDGKEPIEDFEEASKPDVVASRLGNGWDFGCDYINWGMYYEQVRAFLTEFPSVKVFLYEEFSGDVLKVVRDIFHFIGVNDNFIPDIKARYNVSGNSKRRLIVRAVSGAWPFKNYLKLLIPYEMRQKVKLKIYEKNVERQDMPGDIRKELIERYYKDDIMRLGALLNRDLSAWLA